MPLRNLSRIAALVIFSIDLSYLAVNAASGVRSVTIRCSRPLRALLTMSAIGIAAIALPVNAAPFAAEVSIQELAQSITQACFKHAAAVHLPPLSVAVVDESGGLIRLEQQKDAAPLTAEAAVLKAQTAARLRLPTNALADALKDAGVRELFSQLHLTTLPGGTPLLRRDNSLRGAVGVSGAQPAQDAECAQSAAAAASTIRNASASLHDADALVKAIRLRADDYERAWNRGDVQAVIAQYDPSMFAIESSHFQGYAEYVQEVERQLSQPDHDRLRLEVNAVRLLGDDHAVLNGRVHVMPKDGPEQAAPFTVIYRRSNEEWKIIYAHS